MPSGFLRGTAFEAFVAPARPRAAVWRLFLGLGLAGVVWTGATALAVAVALAKGAAPGGPGLTLAALGSFAGLTLGIVLAARLIGRRPPATLIGPGGFRPRAFATGALVVLVIGGAGLAIPLGGAAERQMAIGAWLRLLPFGLLAVLVQTVAEEIAFRGYLTQELGARFRTPVLWFLLPAVLFGALHWDPSSSGPEAALFLVTATVVGLVLGHVTARTGNLSAAMGIHFANNVLALLLLSPSGPLGGLALYAAAEAPDLLRRQLFLDLGLWLAGYGLWLGWNRRGSR